MENKQLPSPGIQKHRLIDQLERPATFLVWGLIILMLFLLGRSVFEPVETPRTALERDLIDMRAKVVKDPRDAQAHHGLGIAYLELGSYGQAASEFKKAIKLKPSVANYYYGLAIAQKEMGNDGDFIKYLIRAAKLNPRFYAPYYELGQYYLEDRQYDEAVKWFEAAIKLFPDSADSHYQLGVAYEKKHDREAAMREYRKVLKYLPDHHESARGLARLKAGKTK